MRIFRRLCTGLLAIFSVALLGCAAVGVSSSADPEKKITDAEHLLDQGRPLPADRLIHEAIAIYRERDDPHRLGYAYGLYGELLQSNAINRAEVPFMQNGFQDKSVTLANRFDKSAEYTRMAMAQYEQAIARHQRAEKYDALTNAHLHLASLHQRLLEKDAACTNFRKALDAYGLNLQRNPRAKPQTPRSGQTLPEYLRNLMRKAHCAIAP